jgi:hypothetical protein
MLEMGSIEMLGMFETPGIWVRGEGFITNDIFLSILLRTAGLP